MYSATASLTALWIVPAAIPTKYDELHVVGFVLVGLVLVYLARRLARNPFMWGSIGSLGIGSLWGLFALEDRAPFSYAPFATWGSIVMIVAIGGWVAARRMSREPEFLPALDAPTRTLLGHVIVTGASATAFLWGRAELAGAWNVTASTALSIVYFASTGTVMIWLGRRYGKQPLRVTGLLLTLLAAGKALVEAFEVPNVAVRIAIFFAVSAFLIAVGYWYRRGADELLEPVSTTA